MPRNTLCARNIAPDHAHVPRGSKQDHSAHEEIHADGNSIVKRRRVVQLLYSEGQGANSDP